MYQTPYYPKLILIVLSSLIGITGYSSIDSIEKMKNALYFRGDVAISYDATPSMGFDPEEGSVKFPPDDMELHEQANLGEGISIPSTDMTDHAVAIVGWGPCQVKHVSISNRDEYTVNNGLSHPFCFVSFSWLV